MGAMGTVTSTPSRADVGTLILVDTGGRRGGLIRSSPNEQQTLKIPPESHSEKLPAPKAKRPLYPEVETPRCPKYITCPLAKQEIPPLHELKPPLLKPEPIPHQEQSQDQNADSGLSPVGHSADQVGSDKQFRQSHLPRLKDHEPPHGMPRPYSHWKAQDGSTHELGEYLSSGHYFSVYKLTNRSACVIKLFRFRDAGERLASDVLERIQSGSELLADCDAPQLEIYLFQPNTPTPYLIQRDVDEDMVVLHPFDRHMAQQN